MNDTLENNRQDLNRYPQHMPGVPGCCYSASAPGGKRPELQNNAIDAAIQAGVKQIAYTSFVNMDHNTSPIAIDHRITEAYLKKSGVAWTMLRNHIYKDRL